MVLNTCNKGLGCALLLLLVGCIGKTQPVRLSQNTPVVVAFNFFAPAQKAELPVPSQVQDDVFAALRERNFAPELVAAGALDFAQQRDSNTRLVALQKAAGNKAVLLVELSSAYYAQIEGRVKWNVYAKTSFALPNERVSVVQVDYPAMLYLPHEGAADALVFASELVATAIGAQLDEVLSGRTSPSAVLQKPELMYFVMVDRFKNGDVTNDVAVDLQDAQGWHGGDLQGVTQSLDGLEEMGVTRVWLSPILQSRTAGFMGHGAFHGYWVDDFMQIDLRFGGAEALVALRDAAAAHNMGLVFDMVVNHTGFDSPLRARHPEWFHGRGAIVDWQDPQQLTTHDVHGLPDLAVERDDVFEYLAASAELLTRLGTPAGYRLDAVKHVPTSFWQRYVKALQQLSANNAFTLGEVFEGRPQAVAAMQNEGGFSRAFDFPLAFALRDVFCGDAPAAALGAVLALDDVYQDANTLVTFVDNHDISRVASVCHNNAANVSAALEALLTLRGVPALTYGTESMLAGESEPDNRGDMRFDQRPLAPVIASLSRLRAHNPVLWRGTSLMVDATQDSITLLRSHGSTQALWVLNTQSTPTLPSALQDCAWAPVLAATAARRPAVWTTQNCEQAKSLAARFVGKRAVHFILKDEDLRVVGSATELGAWEPQQAPKNSIVKLRPGTILAYKLVRLREGGVEWEASKNRYLFVAPGEEPLTVELAWRAS